MAISKNTQIESVLERDGVYYATTTGDSMAPLFHTHEKTVVLRRKTARVGRREVILFHRPNGKYVMHRVVRVTDNGYFTRGDNRRCNDPFVPEDEVLAVMDGYYCGKKFVARDNLRYRAYVFFWGSPNFIKYMYFGFRALMRKLTKKRVKKQK